MKFQRQTAILDIIAKNDVKTQEDLSEMLKNAGFNTTQATISRDIKELRLVKTALPAGGYKYSPGESGADSDLLGRLKTIFRECVIKVDRTQNLVVVKTLNGMANAAAFAIDTMKNGHILGTLAGDDTILIILRTSEEAVDFCDMTSTMMK